MNDIIPNMRHPVPRGTSVIQDLPVECCEVLRLSPFPSEL
ncbi:hypothetical protein THOB06_260062 [Vibrio rotiferianus]|nr:hypothetical protein THOB06_260062 [Vibrio rotiferianus]